LILNAVDPQGYDLTISGDANGSPFTCDSGSCTLNLPPGSGNVNYTVTAAQSGLTASGVSA
jgi:hypothetical protein